MERCQEECFFPHQHQHLFIWMILRVLEVSVELPPKAHVLEQWLVCGPSLCWAGAHVKKKKRKMLVLLCSCWRRIAIGQSLSPAKAWKTFLSSEFHQDWNSSKPHGFCGRATRSNSLIISCALLLLSCFTSSPKGRRLGQVMGLITNTDCARASLPPSPVPSGCRRKLSAS